MKKTELFDNVVKSRIEQLHNSLPDGLPESVKSQLMDAFADVGNELAQKAALLAVAPVEGRYAATGELMNEYFSEFSLIKHRVFVEIQWLEFFIITVNKIPALSDFDIDDHAVALIEDIYQSFDLDGAMRVKNIEKTTNHDVKAVEYYIDDELCRRNLDILIPMVHIGCTSEDINNTAYALMIKETLHDVWLPTAQKLVDTLTEISYDTQEVSMLAHTHGQPASTVTTGKEFSVFVDRLTNTLNKIKSVEIKGKFNGATGCYSDLTTVFPDEDWIILCKTFITEELGLAFNPVTTQIEPHDYIAELCNYIRHFGNIILDVDIDMWMYISINYFKQKSVKGEVGSSVMPHKTNPIFFENSEGSEGIANAWFVEFSNKLVRSRWQRDLSDSTVQRYIGEAIAISLLAIKNILRALGRCEVNTEIIEDDLDDNWEVLSAPIQTMLRKHGIPDAYEQLKELTRGKSIMKFEIYNFVSSLNIPKSEKDILLSLTPSNYIGRAKDIVNII